MTNFRFPVRIYIEDTDAGGIVYYANYLRYTERCRSEWLRALGLGQEQLRQHGLLFVVTETAFKYRRPARLDDLVLVDLTVEQISRARIRIRHEVWRDGDQPELLVEASVTVACMSPQGKPMALPADVQARIESNGLP